ncbi:MAG: arsenate reductase (glutaredoxin) [Flavobacterium sp.]|nr:arsenate reductase (glutaredoxin) [Flavobacterium sp.]
MIKIYHNPRCGKSREGLALVEQSGKPLEVIHYLKDTPTHKDLEVLVSKLQLAPIDLIRQNEKIWVEQFKGKSYSDKELVEIMVTHPILIERPIVVNNNKAVIGRPPSKIIDYI